MVSEAQKRATAKYKRENTKSKSVTFYKGDSDLLDWLAVQPNQNAYMKRLIREDMERGRGEQRP